MPTARFGDVAFLSFCPCYKKLDAAVAVYSAVPSPSGNLADSYTQAVPREPARRAPVAAPRCGIGVCRLSSLHAGRRPPLYRLEALWSHRSLLHQALSGRGGAVHLSVSRSECVYALSGGRR